jgi:hypothetical protein
MTPRLGWPGRAPGASNLTVAHSEGLGQGRSAAKGGTFGTGVAGAVPAQHVLNT